MNKMINSVSKLIFGVGVVDILEQITWSEKQAKQADNLANKKNLQAAVDITVKILERWSKSPNFLEQKLRERKLDNLLKDVQQKQKKWQLQIKQVEKFITDADTILNQDKNNTFDTNLLAQALTIYQQSRNFNYSEIVLSKISKIQAEIEKRNNFQLLVKQGQEAGNQMFYKQSLEKFTEAKKLFDYPTLVEPIQACESRINYEEKYEQYLIQANKLAQGGEFQKAIKLIQPIVSKFPRYDGKQFLEKLQNVENGKICFHAGLLAEKNHDLETAKSKYQEALLILPHLEKCWTRLNIIEIKNQKYQRVLSNLTNINNSTAAYLRGYIYAQQGDFTTADNEWRKFPSEVVEEQRKLLLDLVKRQKMVIIKTIENLVTMGELLEAKKVSLEFLQQYGDESIVLNNLNNHIEPAIIGEKWKQNDWEKLARECEQEWRNKKDIVSLHNWAISTYYYSQIDPSKLRELITAWSIFLTNIYNNPVWKNIIWLDYHKINFTEVVTKVQQILENRIEDIKETDLSEYLHLRDLYRRENAYWKLINLAEKPSKKSSLMFNNLLVSPAGAKYFSNNSLQNYLKSVIYNEQLCQALYTNWGLAIAACLQGDMERAIKIKPNNQPYLEIEKYAHSWLCYHEGCYLLKNNDSWEQAGEILKQARHLIVFNNEWIESLDNIFNKKRNQIKNLSEHLQFAKLWVDLLNSQNAKSYLAEMKAEEVREEIVTEKIALRQALRKFQEIKQIDANNSVVLDLIEKTESIIEKEDVFNMIKNNNFDGAVQAAKRSRYSEVRLMVTDLCIDILLNGIKNNSLYHDDVIKLCNWAYQLSPDD
ncbi:MAG: tetratricopeptide repeat protein, partial [Dolichospermum sp.]